jgi:hypothetical protein
LHFVWGNTGIQGTLLYELVSLARPNHAKASSAYPSALPIAWMLV